MSEPTGFIKNYDLLKEDCKVDDLLDISETVEKFKARIDAIDKPAILGLIGKFGSGKSTMLYQVKQKYGDEVCWIDFEAWKYPERKDLWEGFVLDIADQIGKGKKTKNKVTGKSTTSDIFGLIEDVSGYTGIPALASISKLFKKIFKNSPPEKVQELQEILSALLINIKKDIVIVVEDIDRSGDAGIYFLETLKYFIRGLKIDKRVLVIVPIGNTEYSDYKESYTKCLDYTVDFKPEIRSFVDFIKAVFVDELIAENSQILIHRDLVPDLHKIANEQLNWFFVELSNQPKPLSVRSLKTILRNSDLHYKQMLNDNFHPDVRVIICLETMKHLGANKDYSYYDILRKERKIGRESVYAAFLNAIVNRNRTLYHHNNLNRKQLLFPNEDIKVFDKSLNSYMPYHFPPFLVFENISSNVEIENCYLIDLYLEYL